MAAFRRKRRSRVNADAIVYFSKARNEHGHVQLCVYAECTMGGGRVGPVWSHALSAVRRVLATLSAQCDCGRRYHRHRYTEGQRVTINS